MTKPLLTAIVFTYNHKDWIARCIESLLNQKTDYAYEIRIYDDCSTDGTSDICREYAKKYPEKIKLTVQKENTYTKSYLQVHSYQAFMSVDTKYFCYIDGDDYWCSENKVQTALDFLEKHPEYSGFAHDTCFENKYSGVKTSYIHDYCEFKTIKNPVRFSAQAPFFYASSRIFRTSDYSKLKITWVDYLQYYYHLSKGPIYYHDEIMAVYSIGPNNTYYCLPTRFITDNAAMTTFRLSKLFGFKQDKFCMDLLLFYEKRNKIGTTRYNFLCILKKLFGVKLGWYIWMICCFCFRYGFEVMSINYIYNRKKANKKANESKNIIDAIEHLIAKYHKRINKKYNRMKLLKYASNLNFLPSNLIMMLKKAVMRKKKKILKLAKRKADMVRERNKCLSGTKKV